MLNKSVIQFSVDGWGCVPSLLFDLRPNYGGGNEDNVNSFRRSHACTATLSAPDPAAGHCQPMPPPETPGHSRASLGQSLVGHYSCLLGPGAHKLLFVPSQSLFPQSWVSSGGSVVELMASTSKRACTMPSPLHPSLLHLCGGLLLSRTSTEDIHTQFCLSLCGVSGSWCMRRFFDPSECLWWLWGLIRKLILPLLPSCWGFSFALGCEVSPQSHSSTT